ncbi:uncharacterized protein JN550_003856 [Neoarthrinium moseri]|uniref:uncharacterized protein n=1 Tax=Neoarthrinium moseri TaxID=1658444 RepID=UPI001FDC102A|nr:uncharacterized protein JN550_003856 [Neoarthrinium moseri]KAI1872982.1 hypothetical protein JN550_003856 [Neoarthrinium moseri]
MPVWTQRNRRPHVTKVENEQTAQWVRGGARAAGLTTADGQSTRKAHGRGGGVPESRGADWTAGRGASAWMVARAGWPMGDASPSSVAGALRVVSHARHGGTVVGASVITRRATEAVLSLMPFLRRPVSCRGCYPPRARYRATDEQQKPDWDGNHTGGGRPPPSKPTGNLYSRSWWAAT